MFPGNRIDGLKSMRKERRKSQYKGSLLNSQLIPRRPLRNIQNAPPDIHVEAGAFIHYFHPILVEVFLEAVNSLPSWIVVVHQIERTSLT